MSKDRPLRCFDYVNRPFAVVEQALAHNLVPALARSSAGDAGASDGVKLRVQLGPIELSAGVILQHRGWTRRLEPHKERTTFDLSWRAAKASAAFPELHAELAVYPLSSTETQLELSYHVLPPLGLVGEAIDAIAMHRVAEASVERLLRDFAAYLRRTLPLEAHRESGASKVDAAP